MFFGRKIKNENLTSRDRGGRQKDRPGAPAVINPSVRMFVIFRVVRGEWNPDEIGIVSTPARRVVRPDKNGKQSKSPPPGHRLKNRPSS